MNRSVHVLNIYIVKIVSRIVCRQAYIFLKTIDFWLQKCFVSDVNGDKRM